MANIDEHIKDAMRKGEFKDLPGQGKPLKLDDDPNVPSHMRMANKILRDNDLKPDWMTEGQEIEALREKLLTDIHSVTRTNRTAVEKLREAAKKFNSKVLSYNLKVPQGVTHKRHVNFEQELDKAR